MELEGTVQNGVIVPDGECSLPEGTKVRITAPEGPVAQTVGQRLNLLADQFKDVVSDLPPDYSVNIDHYLYGLPKRT